MSLVLIVEDEALLRSSLARGLARLEGIDVVDAPSVEDALALIDERAPDLIISDIDMPERIGIELIGEIGKRGLAVPIIFVSAYLEAYGAMIPRHANVEVLEKPVELAEIRSLVLAKLGERSSGGSDPFTAVDFLQLAGIGRRSVVVEATWEDGRTGSIMICDGQVWSAETESAVGVEAFAQIAWADDARVRCHTVTGPPPERTLEGTVEGLLMASAQTKDELARDSGEEPDFLDRALRYSSAPPPPSALEAVAAEAVLEPAPAEPDRAFERHLDAGVMALLSRDYPQAWNEFSAANALQSDHPVVQTNLERLSQLGFGEEGKDS